MRVAAFLAPDRTYRLQVKNVSRDGGFMLRLQTVRPKSEAWRETVMKIRWSLIDDLSDDPEALTGQIEAFAEWVAAHSGLIRSLIPI